MISYKIVSNWGKKNTPEISPISPKDPNFKEVILERAYRNSWAWRAGQKCKIRGTPRRGIVKEVIKEHNRVNWINNRPYFITVEFADGKTEVCNPSQLKRTHR